VAEKSGGDEQMASRLRQENRGLAMVAGKCPFFSCNFGKMGYKPIKFFFTPNTWEEKPGADSRFDNLAETPAGAKEG
jgi:hypothetical protein